MTTEGSTLGWKMIFFWWVAELVMTEARPTSEPVPAWVGTGNIGSNRIGVGTGPPVTDIREVPRPGGSGWP